MRSGSMPKDIEESFIPPGGGGGGDSPKLSRTNSISEMLKRPKLSMGRLDFSPKHRRFKLMPLATNNGSIMLSGDSSPTHLYFAEKLLKIKEEFAQSSKKCFRMLRGQTPVQRNSRLKKITGVKKKCEGAGEKWREEEDDGWRLIYQSLFNPLSPKFNSMTNHIRDTKLWKDYLRRLNRKREMAAESTTNSTSRKEDSAALLVVEKNLMKNLKLSSPRQLKAMALKKPVVPSPNLRAVKEGYRAVKESHGEFRK